MLVIPAIDLKGGRCVRLVQGDMQRETVYAEDPVAVARGFERAGRRVDPRRRSRRRDQRQAGERGGDRARSVARVGAKVEVGGGIRDLATLERVLAAGAGRVVLGTAALEDPDVLRDRVPPASRAASSPASTPARARSSVAGWTKDSATDAAGLAVEVQRAGAAAIVFTDIARDGTGDGVNAAAVDALADAVDVPVIASGGVASLDDVRKLRALGRRNLDAVIVGRAHLHRRRRPRDRAPRRPRRGAVGRRCSPSASSPASTSRTAGS